MYKALLDDEILLQHSGAEINKLTDIVGLVPNENDENDINVINHSNYCVADKLPTFLRQDLDGLKILNLNAHSLNANLPSHKFLSTYGRVKTSALI